MINEEVSRIFGDNDEAFKAWVAAWIDTEGCLGIRGRTKRKTRPTNRTGQYRSHRPQLQICQTDAAPLLLIQSVYGGSIHNRKRQEHSRRVYELHMGSRQIHKMLLDAYPYLIVKKEQAGFLLEFYILMDKGLDGRKTRGRNEITEQELQERERLRLAVASYNKRPLSAGLLF